MGTNKGTGVVKRDRDNAGNARPRPTSVAFLLLALAWALPAKSVEPFPQVRPATRAQAVLCLTAGAPLPVPCLSPVVQSLLEDPGSGNAASRRALSFLQAAAHVSGERRWVEQDGTTIRYTMQRGSFDRLDGSDDDSDGRPDVLEAVLEGLAEARRVLVSQMGLPAPDPVEVLLVKVGSGVDGYTIPSGGSDGRPLLVLDASPLGGASVTRRAAAHQYAHAVSLVAGGGVPADWAEALATWTVLRVEQQPDEQTAALLSARLNRLADGLLADALELAAGNAAWLSFVEEAYGPTALRLTIEELGTGSAPATALDRALRRADGETLSSAFREFQLWALLVGERANGQHFSFAGRLSSPQFASSTDGLPALSVQADPPVAPLGAAAVLLNPDETRGGLSVRFEGEVPGRWEADLLLVREGGSLHRVPVPLSPRGRGEMTVPLDGVEQAILMIRNLDSDPRAVRRYTWSAHAVRDYPFELSSIEAVPGQAIEGVVVAWETRSERGLVGFNVLRHEEGSSTETRINPVWVPALGDEATPGSYRFVDTTAAPGIPYSYRIEGITETGLASASDAVVLAKRALSQ